MHRDCRLFGLTHDGISFSRQSPIHRDRGALLGRALPAQGPAPIGIQHDLDLMAGKGTAHSRQRRLSSSECQWRYESNSRKAASFFDASRERIRSPFMPGECPDSRVQVNRAPARKPYREKSEAGKQRIPRPLRRAMTARNISSTRSDPHRTLLGEKSEGDWSALSCAPGMKTLSRGQTQSSNVASHSDVGHCARRAGELSPQKNI